MQGVTLPRLKRPSNSSLKSQYDLAHADTLPRSPGLQYLSPLSGSTVTSDRSWPTPRPHTPLYGGGSGVFVPGNQSSLSLSQKSPSSSPSTPFGEEGPVTLLSPSDGIVPPPQTPQSEYGYITISGPNGYVYDFDEPSVSYPRPPTAIRRISELIDPQSLASCSNIVESPSGNVLSKEAFAAREDRPLSLRERQERIRQEVNQAYAVSGFVALERPATPRSSQSRYRALSDIKEEDPMALPPLPRLPDFPAPVQHSGRAVLEKKHKNKKASFLCF